MRKDALMPAVRAAKQGHECAYHYLKRETRGLVKRVYDDHLSGRARFDDWESEALIVLINSVRCFVLLEQRARFSTYYMQALINKATDLKRRALSKKEQFNSQLLPYELLTCEVESKADLDNPEELLIAKEALRSIHIRKNTRYAKGILTLVGVKPLSRCLKKQDKRQLEQVQYRFKKLLQDALDYD
ncbi:hypothetical protein LQZ24_03760 [Fructobacillus sp. M1-13]|uniref:ComX n=1 Tax=Fructobacillus papyriferae TaxID=2713171 RepID=A0ABS5QPZ2_9LACO|nr:hypothetical protein [Fructobacillus papyriferae]MBS9335190.1 hypothetical protein [Fructobacillus papyriferae]MCD2159141.1 hypothetical protein [Fructobacillus papyriferae]